MKKLLHVGCGPLNETSLTRGFQPDDWHEVRLDIDAEVEPDIVGTMTDMRNVESESVDAIYSSHNRSTCSRTRCPSCWRNSAACSTTAVSSC